MTDIADYKCMAFTTYRKTGEAVTTPVWVTRMSDGRLGFTTAMGTGKTKRLKNNPAVTVQPCSYSGKLKPGTEAVAGTAEMVQSGPLFDEAKSKSKQKYGVLVTLSRLAEKVIGPKDQEFADTVVLVTLDA